MDVLLLSGEQEEVVEEASVKLLNLIAKEALTVSEKKAQMVEKKIKYLGHTLTEGL